MNPRDFDEDLFNALPRIDEQASARLHTRLVDTARRDGVLDIAYRTLDTPVGQLLLAATERGLVRVAYACQDHDQILGSLAEMVSPRVLHAPERLTDAARQLDQYFTGQLRTFDLALDFGPVRGFRRGVLAQLLEIAYGHTASYAEVAAGAGSPRAFRAVGTACATNPLPVVVPCHRVVRSDGSVGDYVGGAEAKNALLNLETRQTMT